MKGEMEKEKKIEKRSENKSTPICSIIRVVQP
jgi:hypothetical protein